MNKCCFIGRLTKDVDFNTTSSGMSFCRFQLAVNRKYKNNEGNYDVDFITMVAWKNIADTIHNYCKKGSLIGISGELQTRIYEKEGVKKYITEVLVQDCDLLNYKNKEVQDSKQTIKEDLNPVEDDDLPF